MGRRMSGRPTALTVPAVRRLDELRRTRRLSYLKLAYLFRVNRGTIEDALKRRRGYAGVPK